MNGPTRRDAMKLTAALAAGFVGGRRTAPTASAAPAQMKGDANVTEIFGRKFTADELSAYVGRMEQVAGVTRFVWDDGKARGVRGARVYTGSGLDFTVALDRAMDIPAASFRGIPLAWVSQVGVTRGDFYEPYGKGWDRTFFGGLVQTCGLRSAGHASVIGEDEFGLHGRISTTPAENVNVTTEWRGDEYVLEIKGRVVQAHSWKENLTLTRTISTKAGATNFRMSDVVANEGPVSSPHTIMYHVNPGFPVFTENSKILWSIARAEGASEAEFLKFTAPGKGGEGGGYFYHKADADGRARAAVVNPALGGGFGLYMEWDNEALPVMITWKQLARHAYLVALEPANCRIKTNAKLREEGALPYLEPGEKRTYELEFGVLDGAEEVERFRRSLP